MFVRELANRFPLTHQLHIGIERAFREYHIEIPFPQRDIHLRYPDVLMHPAETEVISASRSGL